MQIAPGITMIDTRLGGWDGITAAYLVAGPSPALVETGAQTSVGAVTAALDDIGLGAGDLAWLVLTHIHLDHCGGVGDLAAAFPNATVVVHPRGVRHLVDPARLVEASAAVYGTTAHLYGGLRAVAEGRIVAAEDGATVSLGGSRQLEMLEAPGHARHHMMVLDATTGTLFAGDALGVKFPGAGLYPAVPPPEFDLDAALATLDRIRQIAPETLAIGHFGPVDDPAAEVDRATRQQSTAAGAALRALRESGPESVGDEIGRALPLAHEVMDPAAIARWRELGWYDNNTAGLARWAARQLESETV